MRTPKADLVAAAEHLPEGALLTIDDVSWDEYEQILQDFDGPRKLRVSYDEGRLEIMSPLSRHEYYKTFIERMIHAMGDELDLDVEPFGQATWKRERDRKGAEGDSCFYIVNSKRIIGNPDIDINVDPPPDLILEIDSTNYSLSKFPIYAAFGVPEIWRYEVEKNLLHIYELREGTYVEVPASRFFPILSPDILPPLIDQSKTQGQKAALTAFRKLISL